MGYYSVRVGGGDAKVELLGDRDIKTVTYPNKKHNYISNIEAEPIEFKLQIIPVDERQWTKQMYTNVCEWLVHDTYKEFISEDDPSKVYYVIATGATHWEGVLKYGHIEFEFTTNAYHAWTFPSYKHFVVDGESTFYIDNLCNVGDRTYSPYIKVKKKKDKGNIQIFNESDGNRCTELKSISSSDSFDMDNEYHLFITDTPTNYYGKHFNKKWFKLVAGRNKIKVKGNCELTFEMQFPVV